MKSILAAGLIAGAAASALPASAASLLVDNFNYGPTTVYNAPDVTFGGVWKTTGGTVDYLAAGGEYGNLCGGLGAPGCIDLDGSNVDAGVFETVQSFAEGLYQLTFQILGSGRGTSETVTIRLGSLVHTFTIGSGDAVDQTSFGTLFDSVLVGPGGSTLSFENSGGDNIGAVLKSVSVDSLPKVAAVPLPAAGWMLLTALGGMGLMRRTRRVA